MSAKPTSFQPRSRGRRHTGPAQQRLFDHTFAWIRPHLPVAGGGRRVHSAYINVSGPLDLSIERAADLQLHL